MTDLERIKDYLASFRAHLRTRTLAEQEEIVREIHAHIRDAAAEPGARLAAVLRRLGPPHELARQYGNRALAAASSHSSPPTLHWRSTFTVATRAIAAFLVCFTAMFGYLSGGGLVLTAFLKLLFPRHIGSWASHGHLVAIGLSSAPPPDAHELLGWHYIPVILIAGASVLSLTHLAIRSTLRLSRHFQLRLITPPQLD